MTDDHLSLDELAELDEGLLPPERTSAIRAHLHGCGACRDRAEAISATRSMLSDLPRPTMPDDVQARLDDAIAAEAAAAETATRAAEPASPPDEPETVLVDVPARSADVIPAPGRVSSAPRFGRPTLASSAVAAAVVLAVGAIVIGALNHDRSQSGGAPQVETIAPNGNSVIASTQPAHFFQTSTGRDYTLANLQPDIQGLIARSPADTAAASPTASKGTATLGAVAGGSTAQGTQGTQGTTSSNGAAGTPGTPAGAKGGTNGDQKSGRHTATVPAPAPTPVPSLSSLNQQPVPKPLQALAGSRAKILACAAALTGSHNAVPLAVDFGRWTNPPLRRAPSAIFVFKSPDPSAVSVYVTPPACDSGTVYTYRLVPLPG